jgi:hypothetical protein
VVGPDGKTYRMSPDQTQFKLHTSPCVPGRGSKN